jgi:cobalt-zinc-cadmium efflux system membrane fusion protein
MLTSHPARARRIPVSSLLIVGAVISIACLAWWARGISLLEASGESNSSDAAAAAEVEGSHADHGHEAREGTSITISERGLKNIGFVPAIISLQPFERTITVPAIIAEKPGQTQIHLSSPVGGVLKEIYVIQGEAVQPGSKMFDVQLTHEDLVAAQQEYLGNAQSLDIVDREIARLQSIGQGVVAGRQILEQQYEKQRLEASLRAAEQALLVHGLSEEQVAEILETRKLLRQLTVYAPTHSHAGEGCSEEHTFHVQRLPVSRGQRVETSQELAVLADHCELYIEGHAFEDDASKLRVASREGWAVMATLIAEAQEEAAIKDLTLLYLADTIDAESRAFHFYLQLPNQIVSDQRDSENHRFIEWRFKPGQRLALHVPVERWDERIVLSAKAVVDEGAEAYVYRQNGDSFERVAVTVEYRDGRSAVIANDGALFPGDVVADRGAYQMHLAAKNQAGGAVDPHAGHNH